MTAALHTPNTLLIAHFGKSLLRPQDRCQATPPLSAHMLAETHHEFFYESCATCRSLQSFACPMLPVVTRTRRVTSNYLDRPAIAQGGCSLTPFQPRPGLTPLQPVRPTLEDRNLRFNYRCHPLTAQLWLSLISECARSYSCEARPLDVSAWLGARKSCD